MTLQEAILDMDWKVSRGCEVGVRIGLTGHPVDVAVSGLAPEDFTEYPQEFGVELARHVCLDTRFKYNLAWTITGGIGNRVIGYYHRTSGGTK